MSPKITYGTNADGWKGFKSKVIDLVEEKGASKICDIGGGRKPLLNQKEIDTYDLNYTLLDISESELALAPAAYNKICADIAVHNFSLETEFDLVFSQMLAEHIKDGKQFHKNVYKILKPGGIAIHFFPTLYSFPFLINYISPVKLSNWILDKVRPIQHNRGKFPSYYNLCRGPMKKQLLFFKGLNYEIVEYKGFFGHRYYNNIPLINTIHQRWSNWLLNNPNPVLTSFAWIILRRPL